MEIILLGIYCFFVWLIFIKLKLLPWTTPWKVAVAITPGGGPGGDASLLLNIFAPTTTDVRVVKYVVPIVSQVRGRVIEVPVQNNRPVKKGDVLFRIDPVPYESEVHSLEAQLASAEAKVGADRARIERVPGAPARRGSRASASYASNSTRRRTMWPRCRRRSSSPGNAWRRTRSSPRPAPGTVSIWSRPRPTSPSSPGRSPPAERSSNR